MEHPMDRLNEKRALTINGWAMVVALLVLLAADLGLVSTIVANPSGPVGGYIPAALLVSLVVAPCPPGFFPLQPNQARVLLFLGAYQGTERVSGFRWGNPLARKPLVSLRAQNSVIAHLKVNDARGNPIEIG